jgi:hypothetical protein
MTEHEASRTLVKSPPELWAELSDESSLGRHFDQFGEIRITRLEPETAVAWEGEHVSGTVRLEPSGWGTKVILTAWAQGVPAVEARVDDPEPLPPAASSSPPLAATPAKQGFFGRLLGFFGGPRPESAVAVEPSAPLEPVVEPSAPDEPVVEPPAPAAPERAESIPETTAEATVDAAGVLAAALDNLGQAHHRPFSRG